jgi:hypothetical protein
MSKNLNKSQVTISGIITATGWDDHEQVQDVSISATDEQEYWVESDKLGKELLQRVQSQVKVTGWVTQSEDGKKRIRVTRFQIIREYDHEKINVRFNGITYSH